MYLPKLFCQRFYLDPLSEVINADNCIVATSLPFPSILAWGLSDRPSTWRMAKGWILWSILVMVVFKWRRNADICHTFSRIAPYPFLKLASSILVLALSKPVLGLLCGYHKFLHGSPVGHNWLIQLQCIVRVGMRSLIYTVFRPGAHSSRLNLQASSLFSGNV